MKKKVVKTAFMMAIAIFFLFLPLSIFIGDYAMFNILAIADFVLISSLIIVWIEHLFDELTE